MKLPFPFRNRATLPFIFPTQHPTQKTQRHSMKKTLIITTALLAAAPLAHAIFGVGDIVSDPVVEEATLQNNIFSQVKYAWEQTQWAEQLSSLASTLSTVQKQLATANQVKQAIGDPAAASGLIENALFSSSLQQSGISDTLTELAGITQQSSALSGTIQELFQPITMTAWTNGTTPFEGVSSFRDPNDPLKQYRALENAYSRFETLLLQARSTHQTLNNQIAQLNTQLKNAPDDAQVQKLIGSLGTAQMALRNLDGMADTAHHHVELLKVLNQNRKEEEEVAAETISRQRNQQSATQSAAAETGLSNLNSSTNEVPVGF